MKSLLFLNRLAGEIDNTADSSRNERHAGRHSLDQRKRRSLVSRRQRDDIQASQKLAHILATAEKMDGFANADGHCLSLKLPAKAAFANKYKTKFRRVSLSILHRGGNIYEQRNILDRCQAANITDHNIVGVGPDLIA